MTPERPLRIQVIPRLKTPTPCKVRLTIENGSTIEIESATVTVKDVESSVTASADFPTIGAGTISPALAVELPGGADLVQYVLRLAGNRNFSDIKTARNVTDVTIAFTDVEGSK